MYDVFHASLYSSIVLVLILLPLAILKPNRCTWYITIPVILLIGLFYAQIPSYGDRIYYDQNCYVLSSSSILDLLQSEFALLYKIAAIIPCKIAIQSQLRFSFVIDIFLAIFLSIVIYIRRINNSFSLFIITSSFFVCFYATYRLGIAYIVLILLFSGINYSKGIPIRSMILLPFFHYSGLILIIPFISSKINYAKLIIQNKLKTYDFVSIFMVVITITSLFIFQIYNFEYIFSKGVERINSESGSTAIKGLIVILFTYILCLNIRTPLLIKRYSIASSVISLLLFKYQSLARLNGFLLLSLGVFLNYIKPKIFGLTHSTIINCMSIVFIFLNPQLFTL